MPDVQERKEVNLPPLLASSTFISSFFSSQILEAVSRKVTLAPSVDLDEFARATDGFSGADLQALVYNAQLEVIHDTISATSISSDVKTNGTKPDAEQPVEYKLLFGPATSQKVKSRAEEAAFQRRVTWTFRSLVDNLD